MINPLISGAKCRSIMGRIYCVAGSCPQTLRYQRTFNHHRTRHGAGPGSGLGIHFLRQLAKLSQMASLDSAVTALRVARDRRLDHFNNLPTSRPNHHVNKSHLIFSDIERAIEALKPAATLQVLLPLFSPVVSEILMPSKPTDRVQTAKG